MGSLPEKGTYSASRVSAIIGLNQYQTPVHAWQILCEELEPGFNQSRGYKLPDPPDNAAIRWGHAFEDAIIELAEDRYQQDIVNREKLFEKKIENITLSCHIDGIYLHPMLSGDNPVKDTELIIIHEGKTTNARAYESTRQEIVESLDENGELSTDFYIKRKWGEPGTDQVPEEYQVQGAVQRICTGAYLVKLSVLVFPKSADEFEALGCEVIYNNAGGWFLKNGLEGNQKIISLNDWARVFSEMGYFHTYNLERNSVLESEIITAIQNFHERYVVTRTPPPPQNYDDIRRLLTKPIGTIIADPDLELKCQEYAEVNRQLGSKGPLNTAKERLKLEITTEILNANRDNWTDPPDKVVILSPRGGKQLANFAKSGFRGMKL